jgi:uncharacterized repeat protein (TIGR01451 family)
MNSTPRAGIVLLLIGLLTAGLFGMAAPAQAQTAARAMNQAFEPGAADLAITATVDESAPPEGATINYSIVLTNSGPDAATDLQVDYPLPDGVKFISSAVSQGVYVSKTGVWALESLADGASATLTITAYVDAGTDGSTLTGTARVVHSSQEDVYSANDTDSAAIRVRGLAQSSRVFDDLQDMADGLRAGDADLGVVKTVDDPTPPEGGTIHYTVVLTNYGPDTANNIQVDDLLPTGVTYSSHSTTQGFYISSSGYWVLSSLANAASDTLTITATVDSGTGGTVIVNTAEITALDETDNNSSNDSDSASIHVEGADLGVTKTVNNPEPNVGETFQYSIVLTNYGPDAATNVQVTDLLPSGVTFSSYSTTQGTYASATGVWVVGTVAASATATLNINATVDSGTGGSTITNTATVTASDQDDNNTANNSDSVDIDIPVMDLAVTKTVDNAYPNEGETINFTILAANSGPDGATNVEVTDLLPAGLTFVSYSATQGTYSSGTGVWNAGNIAASASATLTITATVNAGTGGTTIINTATLTDVDEADSNPTNNSDTATMTVQIVDLAVTKSVNDPAPSEGDTINYTIVLTNNGPDTASNIRVTDVLPAGVTFSSYSATQGIYTSTNGIWAVSDLDAGYSATLTINATVDIGTGGTTITNTATITDADQADSNPSNDSDSADISVQAADLAITKSVDDTFPNVGDTVHYTVVLTNNGPDATTNVEVTDLLPTGVTFSAYTATHGTYNSGTGIWSVTSLANGAVDTLDIAATVDAGTAGQTITNTASVTASDQPDNTPGNDSDSADFTVQSVDLGVTKSVDDTFPNEGGTVNYTVVLTNNGPNEATGVEVTDLLPSGVTYVSYSATQGSYTSGTGVWNAGTLANAASDTLTITATVDAGTAGSTITNTATITAADQGDGNPANDSDSADLTVQAVDLAINKTVDDTFPNEGGTVNYTVVVTNNGPDAATGVEVTDVLPAGVTYASYSATQGTYDDVTGLWVVGGIANAASATLTLTATVDAGTNGTTIVNTASLTASDQADTNPANDSDTAQFTVQSADLSVTKSVDDTFPNEGDTIHYTVVVSNNGPNAATAVQVTDILPTGVTFVSSSATQGTYASGTGVWNVGGVSNGASATLTLTATVNAGTNGSTITNTASVTRSDQADPNPANDSDSADFTVQSVDLVIEKTVDDATPNEGDTIHYTVALQNLGPDAATNIKVTDLLPPRVTFVSYTATQGSYVTGTGLWSLAGLTTGAADTLVITATVNAGAGGATVTNTATVTDIDQADSNPANNSDSAVLVVQSVDLAILKTVNNPAPNVGATIQYTVAVINNGPNEATSVEVTDLLPTGVTYVSHSATQGSYDSGTGLWTVGTIANAASAVLTLTATVDTGTGGTTIVNTASVTGLDQADSNPANDSDTADIVVQAADLEITKTVDNPLPNEGATIHYTVRLDNNGPNTATNVQVTDLLPAGVTYVSHTTTQGTYVLGTGVWSVGSVANGAFANLNITATVDVGTNGTTIVNTAAVTAADQADNTPGNNSDTASITVQSVDLAINKTVDDTFPNEGGTVNYTVVLTNNGPDGATNVEVTDLLPSGVTFDSYSATQGTYVSGTGVWSVGSVANAASATLTLTATVDAGTHGSTIVNTAAVTDADQADSNPANDSDTASITVQSVDLAIDKTVDDPAPREGDTIDYTVVLTNNGPDAATGVQVTDLLPAGVTFVSSSATQGSYNSVSGIWTVGGVANSASATLTITATVNAGTGGTTIVNTASVTASDQADSNPANNSDGASIDVQEADLAITKSVDNPSPSQGGTINYTVVVTNNGPNGTTGVQVTDVLPAGVTYVSSSPSQGSYDNVSGIWTVGSIANAASATLTITATVDTGTGGTTIVNTASVTASDQVDNNPANDSDTASITVHGADLGVTKTVNDSTPPEGSTIVYTVVLTNNGPDTATNIQVNDQLPAGVTYVSHSVTDGVYIKASGVWILGSVPNGASRTLTLTATVDAGTAGTTITNTATIAIADQPDGNTANNSDSADIVPETVVGADLAIAKTVDDPGPPEGATIHYTIELLNNGPEDATNVEVTDLLPTGVTFVSYTATHGTYVSGTGVWSGIASLVASAADTLTITATVDAGTSGQTITNTATVTASDQPDGNAANNSGSADIEVESADLAVTKTVDDPNPNEGGTIHYSVVLTNNGPAAATAIQVTDALPAGVTYVSHSATQGTYASGTGIWSIASLANAAADTLTITATVDAGTGGTTITNTATRTASSPSDTNPANDAGSADITVQGADLAITKTVDDPNPNVGGTIHYTIELANNGPDEATNVEVTDALPAGVTYVSYSATQGTYDDGTGIWIVASIANAAADTLTITATVDTGTGGTTITNTATVTAADQADGNAANDSDSADITVQGADLAVTKTVDDPNPEESDTIHYTIVLANDGPNGATNVELTDLLPSGVTYVSYSATQGTYDDGTGLWDVGSIANAASATLTLTATVDVGTAGSTITNTAAVTASDQDDGNLANNSDSADITVSGGEADLAIDKSVDSSYPNESDTINYTVVLTNNGTANATGVEVTDLLPTGVTYVSHSATVGTYASGTGLWNVGSIANGVSETLTITATVDTGTGGTTITNTATVTASDQPDPNATNDSDSANITVLSSGGEVQITFDSTDMRATWSPDGSEISFDSARSGNRDVWRVASTGGTAVQITTNTQTDEYPDWSPAGGQIVYVGGPAGALDLLLIPPTGGTPTVLNSGDHRFPDFSPDGTQVAYSLSNDIYTIPTAGGTPFAVTTAGAAESHPTWSPDGTQIAYQSNASGNWDIWVIPATGGTATQITTDAGTDTAPDWSPDGTQIVFQSTRSGNNDIWVIPATGGTATQITTDPGNDNFPTWSPDGTKIAFSRAGIWVFSFPTMPGADLAVSKSVDDPAPGEGDTINYTVVVSNNGPSAATGVEVTDLLPTGVTYSSSLPTQGSYVVGTGTWFVGSIPNGGSATLTLTATVDLGTSGSTITNTAAITASDQDDNNPSNDSDSADITVGGMAADLAIVKTVDDPTPPEGDTIDYTIVLTNNGPDQATNIEVTDVLPTGVTYVSYSATQGSYASGTGIWSVTSLANAASATLTLTATVDMGTGGSTITNTATVTALDQTDGNSANDSDSVDIQVQSTGAPVLTFVPKTYSLEQGRPNPFRERTTIQFDIPTPGRATLSVWDVTGRLVCTIVDGEVAAGRYQHSWDGRDRTGRHVASGIYFVRLQSGTFSATQKVIRVR